jgi:hypothetical protein
MHKIILIVHNLKNLQMDWESTVNQQAMKKKIRQLGGVYKKIRDTVSSLHTCTQMYIMFKNEY